MVCYKNRKNLPKWWKHKKGECKSVGETVAEMMTVICGAQAKDRWEMGIPSYLFHQTFQGCFECGERISWNVVHVGMTVWDYYK